MANIQRLRKAPIKIQLDKERTLRFTLGSLAHLEETYGDINAAFKAAEDGSVKAIINILYAGLRHEDKELTCAAVADLVDIEDLAYVSELIAKAMAQDQPDAVAAGKQGNPTQEA